MRVKRLSQKPRPFQIGPHHSLATRYQFGNLCTRRQSQWLNLSRKSARKVILRHVKLAALRIDDNINLPGLNSVMRRFRETLSAANSDCFNLPTELPALRERNRASNSRVGAGTKSDRHNINVLAFAASSLQRFFHQAKSATPANIDCLTHSCRIIRGGGFRDSNASAARRKFNRQNLHKIFRGLIPRRF